MGGSSVDKPTPYRREESAARLSRSGAHRASPFLKNRQTIMQAIRAIVDTYVRLRNEDALLASRQQRLRVLAMCDAGNPMFERLRSQCLEEIAEIDAGLDRLRPAPPLPDSPPGAPEAEEACDPAPVLSDRLPAPIHEANHPAAAPPGAPSYPPQTEDVPDPVPPLPESAFASTPAPNDARPSPAPIDPSPFLAVEHSAPAIASAPSPAPTGDSASQSAPTTAPQFLAAASPSLLASTILAGSISIKLPAGGAKPEAELMRLQIALQERLRSRR
jgi:hypothetical protein